jgi:hypothetical protein
MEGRLENATLIPATLIPTEYATPDLSRIGVVVYGDGFFGDCPHSSMRSRSGRGLRPVIAEALIEIPPVIGVSTQNLCDFLAFVGGSATRLKPDIEAITAWSRNAIERGAHHRFQPRLSSVQA